MRGVGTFSSGLINGGVKNRYDFIQVIITALTSYQSNGENAWAVIDTIADAGAFIDVVVQSVGDRSLGAGVLKGDTDIFVRIATYDLIGTKISLRNYQDWSPTSHTGNREHLRRRSLNDANDIDWWGVVNEYEAIFIYKQLGVFNLMHFGKPTSPYNTRLNGVARLTAATSAAGVVTVSVDRDITDHLHVGQKTWLLNQTPTGQALKTDFTELVTVTVVTPTAITVSGVVQQPYEIGSFVGLDSVATFMMHHNAMNAGQGMVNSPDGSVGHDQGMEYKRLATGPSEADYDPAFDGMYIGFPVWAQIGGFGAGSHFRGFFDHIRVFARNAQVDGDIYRIEFNNTDKWITFPSLGVLDVAYYLAIGPGAP